MIEATNLGRKIEAVKWLAPGHRQVASETSQAAEPSLEQQSINRNEIIEITQESGCRVGSTY